jgi:hypothetical protein
MENASITVAPYKGKDELVFEKVCISLDNRGNHLSDVHIKSHRSVRRSNREVTNHHSATPPANGSRAL